MSFSDSSFTFEDLFLTSSSPVFLTDPAPTDSPWTTTTTEQPASDGAFGPIGLCEDSLTFPQGISDDLDLTDLDMEDTEGITLGIPDHVNDNHVNTELDFPPVLGAGVSGTHLSDPGIDLLMGLPAFENYTEDENQILSSGQFTDGGITYVEGEQETVIDSGQLSQDHASPESLEARMTIIEIQMEELQKWQASQTERSDGINKIISELLDFLHQNGNSSIVN